MNKLKTIFMHANILRLKGIIHVLLLVIEVIKIMEIEQANMRHLREIIGYQNKQEEIKMENETQEQEEYVDLSKEEGSHEQEQGLTSLDVIDPINSLDFNFDLGF